MGELLDTVEIRYHRGSILTGTASTPFSRWDGRSNCFRASGYRYANILEFLRNKGLAVNDRVLQVPPAEKASGTVHLRRYQRLALEKWFQSNKRGIIVLPTGSGKSFIALKAMLDLNVSCIVVTPTLPLVDQWKFLITSLLNIEPGILGGGINQTKFFTVSTYDSAYLKGDSIGNKFEFVVFDEVHHLAAESYIEIAEMFVAPYRMGLTATLEREDGRHLLLFDRVGPVVYRLSPSDLSGRYLANYEVVRVPVELKPEEKERYRYLISMYKRMLKKANLRIRSVGDFKRLIRLSNRDVRLRKALLAWNEARKVSINSESKIDALNMILKLHDRDKVIIFTEYNDMALKISKRFLIPLISQETKPLERKFILEKFRNGEILKIVTSKVLNEGLDVPDARVAVVLGGTGSKREFVQRLGRILRKKRQASILYEVISKGTSEVNISRRRRRGLNDSSKRTRQDT